MAGFRFGRVRVALAWFGGALACAVGCSHLEEAAPSEPPPLAGSRGGQCLPNHECYGGLRCEAGKCAGKGSPRPKGAGGYIPYDAGVNDAGSAGLTGNCNPAFCPELLDGIGTGCCIPPDGPCGIDTGSGCEPSDSPYDPLNPPCSASACPSARGAATSCCEGHAYPYAGSWTLCGFDYGGGCVIGPELADWCSLGKCQSLSVGYSTFNACCPGGTDARCGSATRCGLVFNGQGGCANVPCHWSMVPKGCIERDQPGVVTTECPSATAILTLSDPRYGDSEYEYPLPGCRRLDGTCALWYGDFGLGCLDTDLVRPEAERGIQCPVPLASEYGRDAGPPADAGAAGGCHQSSDCADGRCSSIGGDPGVCTNGKLGAQCASDAQCESGRCTTDGTYTGICTSGENLEPCNEAADCSSGRCADVTPFFDGLCTNGELDEPCDANAECASLRCAVYPGYFGICVSGRTGELCDDASDCMSGRCPSLWKGLNTCR